jgi:hypothetical protein
MGEALMKIRASGIAAVLILLGLLAGMNEAECQIRKTQEPVPPVQKVKPGRLNGLIETAKRQRMAGVKIAILNEERNVVGTGISNKHGMFQIMNLPEGDYLLRVGDQDVVRLEVTRQATVSTLKIVMPLQGPVMTPLKWTLVGVGGVAVVVGTVAIIHNSQDDSSRGTVSP